MPKQSRDTLLGPNAGRKRADRKKRRMAAEKNGGAANPLQQNQLLIGQPDHPKKLQGAAVVENSQSACSDQPEAMKKAAPVGRLCRRCAAEEASVVVLTCRHLCLCRACEVKVSVCPVCQGEITYALALQKF